MPQQSTRRQAWATSIQRLAFAFFILLALTFAFEVPLGGKLAGEATLTTVKILQAVMIGLWLTAHLLARTWPQTPRRLLLPVGLWLVALFVSTLLAPDYFAHTIRFLSRIGQGLLLAWIAVDLVNSPARWRVVLYALVTAGLGVALLGLAEAAGVPFILNFLLLFHDAQTHVGDVLRVSSTLGYATITAMVLEMLIPLTVAATVTARRSWLKGLLSLAVLIEALVLVLTLTRGAILGLGVALVFYIGVSLFSQRRGNALAALGTIGAVAVSMGLLVLLNPTVGLRLFRESENNWYQAHYSAPAEVSARPNALLNIPVQVTNTGLLTWQAKANLPFRLGYSLVRANDKSFKALDGPRTELPGDVAPGQSTTVMAQVPVPEAPGTYSLQWDMVEETVLWFSWRGSALGNTQLIVAGEPLTSAPRRALSPANHSTAAPPVERPVLWSTALRIVRDRPFFGIGPDNFRWVYGRYLNLASWDTNIHANSIYFEFLADTGLVGLLIFVWLTWRMLRLAWQGLRQQTDGQLWVWQLALLSSLIAWFIHGFLDYFYEFAGTYILFWIIAGLAVNMTLHRQPVRPAN